MKSILKRTAAAFFSTLGVLIVFGLLVNFVNDAGHGYLYSVFGWGGIVLTGLIGTPVHEFSHWLGCKIFGLNVTDVKLFRPIAGRSDGVLGYVRFSYSQDNLWQKLGCFFTGIAPLVLGGLIIILVLRFLTPEVFNKISQNVAKTEKANKNPIKYFGAAVSGLFSGFFSLRRWGILRGVICFYLITSISMHMSLSPQDLSGSLIGLAIVVGLYFIYGIITELMKKEYKAASIKTALVISSFMSVGLFFSVVTLVVSWALNLL